jgi:HAD superfamily hydrolase (TIGR01484 family)
MKPLAELRGASRLRGLLFDIDDTLTTDGRLTAAAYAALERLKRAGRIVVAVTGRPAGWCDHIARMWPVDAVVGENGAFYFRHEDGRLHKRYHDPQSRAARSPRTRRTAKLTWRSITARTSRRFPWRLRSASRR